MRNQRQRNRNKSKIRSKFKSNITLNEIKISTKFKSKLNENQVEIESKSKIKWKQNQVNVKLNQNWIQQGDKKVAYMTKLSCDSGKHRLGKSICSCNKLLPRHIIIISFTTHENSTVLWYIDSLSATYF